MQPVGQWSGVLFVCIFRAKMFYDYAKRSVVFSNGNHKRAWRHLLYLMSRNTLEPFLRTTGWEVIFGGTTFPNRLSDDWVLNGYIIRDFDTGGGWSEWQPKMFVFDFPVSQVHFGEDNDDNYHCLVERSAL